MAQATDQRVKLSELSWPSSTVLTEILEAWAAGLRRILLEGGTRSTKTWSALQALIMIAQFAVEPILISIVSESLPHLKRGAIRDFFNILGENPDYCPYWSKTEFTYKRPNWNGKIEFFGADDVKRVTGLTRDILYMNEANNISQDTGLGLDIRTSRFTIADWNPTSHFWIHDIWKDSPENAYNHSTYKDALHILPKVVVDNIESMKDKDPNWWNIFGLGLEGKIEGLVYPKFEQVDELPPGEYFYGLDYGFASDPTVLVKNVIIGENLYSQQMFYDFTGLTNDQIGRKATLCGVKREPIYPDPNEPKSAEELRKLGFNVRDTVKGAGSVAFGRQRVNQFYQHWTKDSLDCITEQRNFRYIKDRMTGDFTDKTTHKWSHGQNARRYAVASYRAMSHIIMEAVAYI